MSNEGATIQVSLTNNKNIPSPSWVKTVQNLLIAMVPNTLINLNKIESLAYPGLMSILDTALYKSYEGALTKTICSAHVIIELFLELKQLSNSLLHECSLDKSAAIYDDYFQIERIELAEEFARLCLECVSSVIERLTTDRLASTANLQLDPNNKARTNSKNNNSASSSSSSSSDNFLPGMEHFVNNDRNTSSNSRERRRVDCWESPRLFCPDYIWADDCFIFCQKVVRALLKHRFLSTPNVVATSTTANMTSSTQVTSDAIMKLLNDTLLVKLSQFRLAIDADAYISKRLYLIKCEYRAPFRAFLEGHASLQRAPRLSLLKKYLSIYQQQQQQQQQKKQSLSEDLLHHKIKDAEQKLSSILEDPTLINALQLEQQCEIMELSMSKMLFSFCELARFIQDKKAHLTLTPHTVEFIHANDLPRYNELLRRLKLVLARKVNGQESSTGIRPILLDLQGIQRHHAPHITPFESSIKTTNDRIAYFLTQLQTLLQLSSTKGSFIIYSTTSNDLSNHRRCYELDIPNNIIRECQSNLDTELFTAQYNDWYTMVQMQHTHFSSKTNLKLSEQLYQAELEVSIAKSNPASLLNVQNRIEQLEKERHKRFEIMQSVLKDVCLREMNLHLNLILPEKDLILELPEMKNALGVFGPTLLFHGEKLALG